MSDSDWLVLRSIEAEIVRQRTREREKKRLLVSARSKRLRDPQRPQDSMPERVEYMRGTDSRSIIPQQGAETFSANRELSLLAP